MQPVFKALVATINQAEFPGLFKSLDTAAKNAYRMRKIPLFDDPCQRAADKAKTDNCNMVKNSFHAKDVMFSQFVTLYFSEN
jgi:hypothetical protein